MLQIEKGTRSIAILLVISLIFTMIAPIQVHAKNEEELNYLIEAIANTESNAEAIAEAKEDATCSNSTNDWKTAREKDYLPWNYFHIAVQDEIREKYKIIGMGEKELHIDYRYTKEDEKNGIGKFGELTGDNGSADLYLEKSDGFTYIWEVKPISYRWEPRKTKGEAQLARYVNNAESYRTGDSTIANGSFKKSFYMDRGNNITEHITYTINYYNQGNGMILYTFKRSSKKEKKKNNESSQENTGDSTGENTGSNTDDGTASNPGDEIQKDPIDDLKKAVMEAYIERLIMIITSDDNFNNDDDENNNGGSDNVVEFPTTESVTETENNSGAAAIRYTPAALGFLYTVAVLWEAEGPGIKYNEGTPQGAKYVLATGFLAAVAVIMGPSLNVEAAELTPEQIEEINDCADLMMGMIYALYGEALGDELLALLEEGNEEKIREILERIQKLDEQYEKASNAAPPRDPLIIDLGEEGIVLTSLEDGVNFDLDNNSFEEKTAWIGTEDGFLALDKNNNGQIDNGGELFGDKFVMPDGTISSTGFEALSSLDDNADSAITEEDNEFVNLRVWIDANHDGKADESELKTLEELNISKISLIYTVENNVDTETGTMRAEYSTVSFSDGAERTIGEFWFPVNSSDTTQDGEKTAGNVPDIIQAVNADESGVLQELCLAFNDEKNINLKRKYLKQVLYYITGASDIEPDSRGGNIDARDLKVIEAFMGREFEGVSGSNPNAPAAEILKQIYTEIENYYYNILNLETSFGGIISIVGEREDVNGQKQIDLVTLAYIIDEKIKNGEDVSTFIYDSAVYLISFDKIHGTNAFAEFSDYYSQSEYAELLELAKSGNTYLGTSSNDIFAGTANNDFVFGNEGDDRLSTGNGTDFIYGGEGDDVLNGGEGDDSYYFEENHGNDQVIDQKGNSSFIFKDGLKYEDYELTFNENDELVLTHNATGENITLKNFIDNPAGYDFYFGDETIIIGGGDKRKVINGTSDRDVLSSNEGLNIFHGRDGNDLIYGGDNMDIIYGDSGDDELYGANGMNLIFGGAGNDTIYDGDNVGYIRGGDGDDTIYAGGGADKLDGGLGDDCLQGNHGDDTYIYKKDYNVDRIVDSAGSNIVRIYGYTPDDMVNTRNTQNELIIGFKDSEDQLIIEKYFDDNNSRSFKFVFDNGVILEQTDIVAEYAGMEGTDADDWLTIQDDNGGIAHGRAGNDGINGGRGNDELYGDEGNDTLYGNDGDDILDGGTGNDSLNGGNGNDIYIFGRDYGNDVISDWGGDSVVKLTDISSKDITITEQNNSNLVITVNESGETLIINGFKWNQGVWTFEFSDGAVATVNKTTLELEFIIDPDNADDGSEEVDEPSSEETEGNETTEQTGDSETTEMTTEEPESNEATEMTTDESESNETTEMTTEESESSEPSETPTVEPTIE